MDNVVGHSDPTIEGSATDAPRSIPLRPLPLGLLVCTLAWSPVGFALIVGGGRLRARLRKRRGLCTACGYNITGVTRCPECGVPVA
jgi:hypothetical protein